MNFTIEAGTAPRIEKKQQTFRPSCQLTINRYRHNYEEYLKAMLSEYFSVSTFEQFRLGELIRLIKMVVVERTTSTFIQEVVKLFKNGGSKQLHRYYDIWKMLVVEGRMCLAQILGEVTDFAQRVEIYGIVLSLSLFLPHRNLLIHDLEASLPAIRSESTDKLIKVVQRVLDQQSQSLNMNAIVHNLKTLTINSSEFRQLLVDLYKKLSGRLNALVKASFQRLLSDLVEQIPNNSHVEYMFQWLDHLQPLYSDCIKAVLTSYLGKGQTKELLKLHSKLSAMLATRQYLQLVNLLEICFRQWMNFEGNGFRLIAKSFEEPEIRAYVLDNLVGLLENYKEVEKIYIRLELKRIPNLLVDLPAKVQKITGRNYSSKLETFMKQATSTMVRDGCVTVVACSKLYYPREWKQLQLSRVLDNPKITKPLQESYKDIMSILNKLLQQQSLWNSYDRLKHYAVVHHRITVDGHFGTKIISLEQLLNFCIAGELIGDYDSFYPTVEEQTQQQRKEQEEVPNYVIESKIVRYLKRNKVGTSDVISREIGSSHELTKVLLDQLIKKQFVRLEQEVYHYVP